MTEDIKYVVNGYKFADEEDYKDALNDKEGVNYLRTQIDLNDTTKAVKLYCDIVEKNVFHTPIGIEYMKKMRALIIRQGGPKDLPYVNVPAYAKEGKTADKRVTDGKSDKERNATNYREKLRTSIIVNVVLILMVIIMFAVALSSSNPNIINYERVLQDKYAGWAQELNAREQELRQRENALDSQN